MIAVSVAAHGLLIAVAAAWPERAIPPDVDSGIYIEYPGDPPAEDSSVPPEAELPPPAEEEPVPTPTDEIPDPFIDTMPPPVIPPPAPRPLGPPRPAAVLPQAARLRSTAIGHPGSPAARSGPPSAVAGGTWSTPKPVYPFQARRLRLQGSGGVRVTTDGTGRVVSAVMSPGVHPLLDATALAYARTAWKGPPNTTRTVPISFVLE